MTDLLCLIGLALIVAGSYILSFGAGLIATGIAVIAVAVFLERAGVTLRSSTGDEAEL